MKPVWQINRMRIIFDGMKRIGRGLTSRAQEQLASGSCLVTEAGPASDKGPDPT